MLQFETMNGVDRVEKLRDHSRNSDQGILSNTLVLGNEIEPSKNKTTAFHTNYIKYSEPQTHSDIKHNEEHVLPEKIPFFYPSSLDDDPRFNGININSLETKDQNIEQEQLIISPASHLAESRLNEIEQRVLPVNIQHTNTQDLDISTNIAANFNTETTESTAPSHTQKTAEATLEPGLLTAHRADVTATHTNDISEKAISLPQNLLITDNVTPTSNTIKTDNSSAATASLPLPTEGREAVLIQNLETDIIAPQGETLKQTKSYQNANLANNAIEIEALELTEKTSLKSEEISHPKDFKANATRPSLMGLSDAASTLTIDGFEKPIITPMIQSITADVSSKAIQSSLPLTTLSQSHPAIQSVAQNLLLAQETQKGISIRLDPPEMGRVFIDFQFDTDRNVVAVIRTEVAETASLLRDRSEFFQQILKENGFDSANLSFEHNENSKNLPFDEDHQSKSFSMGNEFKTSEALNSEASQISYKLKTNSELDIKL